VYGSIEIIRLRQTRRDAGKKKWEPGGKERLRGSEGEEAAANVHKMVVSGEHKKSGREPKLEHATPTGDREATPGKEWWEAVCLRLRKVINSSTKKGERGRMDIPGNRSRREIKKKEVNTEPSDHRGEKTLKGASPLRVR